MPRDVTVQASVSVAVIGLARRPMRRAVQRKAWRAVLREECDVTVGAKSRTILKENTSDVAAKSSAVPNPKPGAMTWQAHLAQWEAASDNARAYSIAVSAELREAESDLEAAAQSREACDMYERHRLASIHLVRPEVKHKKPQFWFKMD
eukprot:2004030-Rhodomonas_salina.2